MVLKTPFSPSGLPSVGFTKSGTEDPFSSSLVYLQSVTVKVVPKTPFSPSGLQSIGCTKSCTEDSFRENGSHIYIYIYLYAKVTSDWYKVNTLTGRIE